MQKATKTIFAAVLTSAILSFTSFFAAAQFPFNIGSPATSSYGQGICSDPSGNVYITGEFTGTANFNPSGSNTMTSSAGGTTADMYVAKYDATGAYQWSLHLANGNGGTYVNNSIPKGIATDNAGGVYVTAAFASSLTFYDVNNASVGTTIFSQGNTDAFVAKYDGSGVLQWDLAIAGSGADAGIACATDAANNVLVTGSYSTSATFYDITGMPTLHTLASSGGTDCFVAKFNSAGAYQWSAKGGSTNADVGNAITSDLNGDVYVTGSFGAAGGFGAATAATFVDAFSTSAPTLTTYAGGGLGSEAFVIKFDATGAYKWETKLESNSFDAGNGIATDASGNVYVGGHLGANPFNVYDAALTTIYTLPNVATTDANHTPGNDVFLVKYNSAGAYQWGTNMGGPSGDNGGNIATDKNGNILIQGHFQSDCVFYSTDNSSIVINYGWVDNFFAAEYDTSGIAICALGGGSSTGNNNIDASNAIASDPSGNMLLTGDFTSTVDFDPGPGTKNLTAIGTLDAFFAKYSSCALSVAPQCTAHAGTNQPFCQGGTAPAIGAAPTNGHTYSWSPATGLSSSTVSQPTATPTATTTYTLTETVTANSCSATGTVVVTVGANPATPVITPTGPIAFCNGGNVTLGTTIYSTYLWSTGSNAQSIPVSTPGVYSVTVTNASGCSAVSLDTTVTVYPLPAAAVGSSVPVCPGVGRLIGAPPVSNDTYSWSPAAGLSSSTVSQPNASPTVFTTYTLTERTANGCTASNSVLVVLAQAAVTPVISAAGLTTICPGASVNLTSTNNNYASYLWSNGATTQTIAASIPAAYSVTVTNASACSANSTPISVTISSVPGDNTGGNKNVCSGGGSITIGATAIVGDTYSWSPAAGLNSTSAPEPTATPTITTTYTLIETNAAGCSVSHTAVLTLGSGGSQGIITATSDTICKLAQAQLTVTGTQGPIQWQSSTNALTGFTNISAATNSSYAVNLSLDTYFLVLSGSGNCAATSVTHKITVSPVAKPVFTETVSGKQVSFDGSASTNAASYAWDFGDGTTSTEVKPVHVYSKDSTYHFCLGVTNGFKCNYSLCDNVTTGGNGVNNIEDNNIWQVYPDPFGSQLYIKMGNESALVQNVEIYDVLGRSVFFKQIGSQRQNPIQLDMSNIKTGMYLIKIKTQDNDLVKPVIKE